MNTRVTGIRSLYHIYPTSLRGLFLGPEGTWDSAENEYQNGLLWQSVIDTVMVMVRTLFSF